MNRAAVRSGPFMLPEGMRYLAENPLREIAATEKGTVRASRKGICAAVKEDGRTIIFRRVQGTVQLHLWSDVTNGKKGVRVTVYLLPIALEARAARMLDDL